MSDMYAKVQKKVPQEKRHLPVWCVALIGIALLVVLGLVIIRPLAEHRRFIQFLSDLSTDTVYASEHNSLCCERSDGQLLRLTPENTYAVYSKLVAGGDGTRSGDVPDGTPYRLDYGNGHTLQIWQMSFSGAGRHDGIFVLYTGADGEEYAYKTNRVPFSNLAGVLSADNNPAWQ